MDPPQFLVVFASLERKARKQAHLGWEGLEVWVAMVWACPLPTSHGLVSSQDTPESKGFFPPVQKGPLMAGFVSIFNLQGCCRSIAGLF